MCTRTAIRSRFKVIEALYAQKRSWFKERYTTGAFARSEMKQFLYELAEEAALRHTLYLAWLSCGDTIVACHMGFISNKVLYLYLTTFDAVYAAYSPGNLLMVETIKWGVDQKMRELDFMRGDEAYKKRFASGTRPLAAFITSGSWLGRVALLVRGLRSGAMHNDDSEPESPSEENEAAGYLRRPE